MFNRGFDIMKTTIKDVARLAGVSPSTVSRVISDSPRISDETKKTVKKAMEKSGYHPNAIARSLVNRSTNTIGIVMPQSTRQSFLNPFFPMTLSGISEAAHKEGYCLLLSTGNDENEQLDSILNIVMGGRVDGVIIMFSSLDDVILRCIAALKIPVLIIGKPISSEGILYVDNDNVKAAYDVTEELIKRGHKKIGLISGPFSFMVSIDRLDGYRNALMHYGIEFSKKYIKETQFLEDSGYNAMTELLTMKESPTGIVITDDLMAFGAINAAKKLGVNIPKDIEIISFNNIPLAEFCSPSLTSVDINSTVLGYESAKLMIEKIKGIADKEKVIVPTKIVYRQTLPLHKKN